MFNKIVHYINDNPLLRLELSIDDIELAKMELQSLGLQGPEDTRWLQIVLQFRDAGHSFAEAASIVYLARKQLSDRSK